jgi:hypothetical protein
MAMPLDIPWVGGVWADEPGFTPPADGAALPGIPTDLDGNVVSVTEVTWATSIGGKDRPAFWFEVDNSRFAITPTYSDVNVMTAVVVGQITDPVAGGDLMDGPAPTRRLLDAEGGVWRTFAEGALVSGGTADTDMHLFILYFTTGGNETLEVDTVQVFNGNAGSATNSTIYIGSSNNGFHFGSKIAFAGVIDRALTTQEKDDLWAWYQADYVNYSAVSSKRDALLASLPGTGTVSDRLHAREEAEYAGTDPTEPLTLNDYLVANGDDKNIIQ